MFTLLVVAQPLRIGSHQDFFDAEMAEEWKELRQEVLFIEALDGTVGEK